MGVAAMQHMYPRDISSDVDNVKNTFSSWDNCMSEAYCKWPVIAAIIIGSLIVLSILFCIGRCLCCGLECCCGCCSCFNACCPSPRRSRSKHQPLDDPPPFTPQPYQGYQSQPPPSYGPPRPQFATFDVSRSQPDSKPLSPDSLPAMPSWETASTRKIESEELPPPNADDDVEMGNLDPAAAQRQPLVNNAELPPEGYHEIYTESSPRRSPTSPPLLQQQQYGAELPGGDLGNYNQRGPSYAAELPTPPPAGFSQFAPPQQQRQSPGPYGYAGPRQQQQPPALSLQTRSPPPMQQPYQTRSPPPAAQQQSYQPQPYQTYSGERSFTPYSPGGYNGANNGGHVASPPPAGSNLGFRPPSLLQAGRKPVQGTWRDV